MATDDIAKEIVIAMIEKGAFTFYGASNEKDLETPVLNAKAVAAAFDVIYAGILDTYNKKR